MDITSLQTKKNVTLNDVCIIALVLLHDLACKALIRMLLITCALDSIAHKM